MISYFDTSFALAYIFNEMSETEFFNFYNNSEYKMSSIIFNIELIINVNKYIEVNKIKGSQKEKYINVSKELIKSMNLINIKDEIIQNIEKIETFYKAKSLDAIHLSTAYFAQMNIKDDVLLLSYDKNMNKIGKMLGLSTLE